MIWFLFAFLGAFFDATYFMLVKKLLKEVDQYVLATGIFFFAFAILFTISWLRGFPALGDAFLYSVISTTLLNILAIILSYRALKISDLSLTIPMISFTPAFLILTSFIMLAEFPSQEGIFGIMLIVVGSYVLNSTADQQNMLEPLSSIFRNRGPLYMLVVAFLYSISSNYDKMVVLNSDIFFGTSIVCLLISVTFLVISLFKRTSNIITACVNNLSGFLLIGIVITLIAVSVNIALTMQIVPYVISVKRFNALFSVAFGILIFKETNVRRKGFGAVIMALGAIIIFLF
ncbi:EamA family transporter [Methanococcoides sp. LMO-2]|uniref:EamA family transporter n=1 Tax=Methanococcoides cohabitans TaxID=3136559 RepID=A0ABU9KQP0_9EURY